jgi:hypothetical protein
MTIGLGDAGAPPRLLNGFSLMQALKTESDKYGALFLSKTVVFVGEERGVRTVQDMMQ